MGICASRKEKCILMVGLDGAGKTTILYKLKLGEVVSSVSTVGFNVEKISFGGFKLVLWDVGGQERIRPLWRHYYTNTDFLIFVVDSTDKTRIAEAKEELQRVINHEDMSQCPVLIFANKQDKPGAMTAAEIEKEMKMQKTRNCHVQATSATTGEGLYEGLAWAVKAKKTIQ